MVTLIGGEIGIDDVAAAIRSTGREVLSHLLSAASCQVLAICKNGLRARRMLTLRPAGLSSSCTGSG